MRRELLLGLGILCGCAHVRDFRDNGQVKVLQTDIYGGEYVLVEKGPFCQVSYRESIDSHPMAQDWLHWPSTRENPAITLRLTREYCKDE